MHQRLRRLVDEWSGSFAGVRIEAPLVLHVAEFPLREALVHSEVLGAACEHHLAHRFDLLGSGRVSGHHGMACRGVEGHRYQTTSSPAVRLRINSSNVEDSERLYGLVEGDYTPIDWQLDFKSGYRWQEGTWYTRIAIPGDHPGADIKVPWELARCQHLPQLALAYGLATAGTPGFRPAACYRREFRNQVIDFMANNPPRYGVNWSCAMDVGIRVANWLLAYDLFLSAGAEFDPEFERILKRSVYEHGRHLARNLEWNDQCRSNHYLADLVGLLYAGAYLPTSVETDTWVRLAAHELRRELALQFNDDGSNFEASTSYHRLSAELFAYAIALMMSAVSRRLSLPWADSPPGFKPGSVRLAAPIESLEDIVPPHLAGRLERAAEFTMHITRPDGHITQIGDNDSGRLFKLQPGVRTDLQKQVIGEIENPANRRAPGPTEDCLLDDTLDHRHLVGALGALFGRSDCAAFAESRLLDGAIIRLMCHDRKLKSYRNPGQSVRAAMVRVGTDADFSQFEQSPLGSRSQRYRFRLGAPLKADSCEFLAYPDFGLYVIRNSRFFLAIRCGPDCQAGNGAHAHNDQLAVELVIDGYPVALDPGSYLYTALPQRRNEYRSVRAHFAPHVDGAEPGDLSELFMRSDTAGARCLYFGPRGFMGRHHGYGRPVYRIVALEENAVEIRDYAEGLNLVRCRFSVSAEQPGRFLGVPFSQGYGLQDPPMPNL